MKRFYEIVIFALCIAVALAPAVSANSGPTWWEGTTASGLTVTGADCPIVVDHENLTFDLTHVPREHYADESAFRDYDGTVTAEYHFRNPTDADVTMELLFPFGIAPQYAPTGRLLPHSYTVTVDGEPVEAVLRHSLSWGDAFVMMEDSARLQDDFMAHSFYTPQMPVTRYIYRPEGVDWEEYDSIRAMLRLDSDPALTKYILEPANSYSQETGYALTGSTLREGDVAELYIIGQVPEEPLTWTLSKGGDPIGGTMELVDSGKMSLLEYIRLSCTENADVSEVDLYNAFVELMDRVEAAHGYLSVGFRMELMCWYEYTLTIPAGGTLVNTVTAPMYPDIHTGWDPPLYSYKYLLSPAKGWADFGTLDIFIRGRHILRECNMEGFRDTGYGHELHLEGLPDKELEFVLCSSAHPVKPGSREGKMLWLFGGISALAVFGLRRVIRGRRKGHG